MQRLADGREKRQIPGERSLGRICQCGPARRAQAGQVSTVLSSTVICIILSEVTVRLGGGSRTSQRRATRLGR